MTPCLSAKQLCRLQGAIQEAFAVVREQGIVNQQCLERHGSAEHDRGRAHLLPEDTGHNIGHAQAPELESEALRHGRGWLASSLLVFVPDRSLQLVKVGGIELCGGNVVVSCG